MAERGLDRWLRPRYVFPALAALLVLGVLLTPQDDQDPRSRVMTTHSQSEWGVVTIYKTLNELHIPVSRRETPLRAPLDSDAVYFVLAPMINPSARESSALLDAVRRGAGLVVVAENGPPLSDSVGVGRSTVLKHPLHVVVDSLFGTAGHPAWDPPPDTSNAPVRNDRPSFLISPADQGARAFFRYVLGAPKSDSDSTRVFAPDTVTLLSARADGREESEHTVIMGRQLGRGRIVMIADANFLRNGALAHAEGGVLTVRLLEWVSRGAPKPVVFDEYHQGYGSHDNLVGTIYRGLRGDPAGRALLQLALASLLLILALSVRPIAPVRAAIIERRSPLEHVGALSRAYAAVGATRLASRRLVRGLRRRHPLGATGALDDDGYLRLLRERAAGVAADAAFLHRAIHEPLPAAEFARAGLAIDHIERTLTS